jgi:ketosteroid isomerase-like protein
MADTEQNKAVVRECYVAASGGDRAALREILQPDFVIHTPEDYNGVTACWRWSRRSRPGCPT